MHGGRGVPMTDEEYEAVQALKRPVESFEQAVTVAMNPHLPKEQRDAAYEEVVLWRPIAAWSGALDVLVTEALDRLPEPLRTTLRDAREGGRLHRLEGLGDTLEQLLGAANTARNMSCGFQSGSDEIAGAVSWLARHVTTEAPLLGAQPCPYDVYARALQLADCPPDPRPPQETQPERWGRQAIMQIAYDEAARLKPYRQLLADLTPHVAPLARLRVEELARLLDRSLLHALIRDPDRAAGLRTFWGPVDDAPGTRAFHRALLDWSRFEGAPRSRRAGNHAAASVASFAQSIVQVDVARRWPGVWEEGRIRRHEWDPAAVELRRRVWATVLARIGA